MNAILIKTTF